MNELQIFNYEDQQIRTEIVDDKPWFCLIDVCKILELSQVHRVSSSLDEDDRTTITVIDSMGRSQKATFVNESGLYQVIFQSRKPEAKKFKKWVTSEVLPAIRKTGKYEIQSDYQIPQTYSEALRQLADKVDENEKLIAEKKENEPYIEFGKQFEAAKGNILTRQLGKMLGLGQNEFFKWLHENKILFGNNEVYEYYRRLGWAVYQPGYHQEKGKKVTHYTVKWTPKGQYGIWKKYNNVCEDSDMISPV